MDPAIGNRGDCTVGVDVRPAGGIPVTPFLPLAALLFVLLAPNAFAGDRWDRTDKILLGTCLAAEIMDYGQTTHIARNPKDHFEYNPFPGDHPSPARVKAIFLIGAAANIIIAELLPSKYRKLWLGGMTILSGTAVLRNHGQGISFEW